MIGVRREHVDIGTSGIEMHIDVVKGLGAHAYLYGRIALGDDTLTQPVVVRADGRDPPARGSRVRVRPQPEHLHFFGIDGRRLH